MCYNFISFPRLKYLDTVQLHMHEMLMQCLCYGVQAAILGAQAKISQNKNAESLKVAIFFVLLCSSI